jgi:hypothetical protein
MPLLQQPHLLPTTATAKQVHRPLRLQLLKATALAAAVVLAAAVAVAVVVGCQQQRLRPLLQ